MPKTNPTFHSFLAYLASGLIAATGLLLGLVGQGVLAASLLAITALSGLTTRQLLGKLERANRQKSLLDQQLIQSQKLASIGELSAGIAHEINNPLAIIAREAEWMGHLLKSLSSQEAQAAADFQDSLREISRQVDRCKEITQNLLNFARKMEPVIQRVNLNRLIEDMIRLVERETKTKNIVIDRQFQEGLPAIPTDPPCVRQVLLNLLNNARQAIGEEGTITVRTSMTEDGAVEIVVADTGCGIPRQLLSKIFDPFFTTKPQGKGTGLGLSICHGMIDRLGGSIAVTSEVGRGTTFTIRLPQDGRKEGSENVR